jgi:hypothetical protein
MKAILMTLILSIGMSAAAAQTSTGQQRQKPVNWALLNPKVLDMAFDLLEDLNLQADVIGKSDEVYSPREADSRKLESKLNRIVVTPADGEANGALALYYFQVNTCGLMSAPDAPPTGNLPLCSSSALNELRNKAEERLEEIKKLHAASQKRKPAAPATR